MSLSGDSIAIVIRCDKLVSFKLLHGSTEAVATKIDQLIVAMVCRFGNMVVNMSFETMSVSCDLNIFFGFHSHKSSILYPLGVDLRGNKCFLHCWLTK